MRLEISALSKPGGRPPNEDAFGCWSSEAASFCLLCDGAGGHGGGEIASKLAVRVALGRFQAKPECSGAAIDAALRAAQEAIVAAQAACNGTENMRATAAVLAIDTGRGEACWGHLGDTRLYGFRNGAVLVRTKDHSVVQRMVDAGYIRDEDLRSAPDRSQLFAALGQAENFAPAIAAETWTLQDGDVFLLCTDGFWGVLPDDLMLRTLAGSESTQAWLEAMEREVVARGGPDQDNYSALTVWCGKGGLGATAGTSGPG